MILQKEDLQNVFQANWEKYLDKVLKYAVSHKTPTKDLRHALREYTAIDEDDDDIGKGCAQMHVYRN